MAFSQIPDEFLNMADSYQDHLIVCRSPEDLTGLQYEGILLQALSTEYKGILRLEFVLPTYCRWRPYLPEHLLSRNVENRCRYEKCRSKSFATSDATIAQYLVATGGNLPTIAESIDRMDGISNALMDGRAC